MSKNVIAKQTRIGKTLRIHENLIECDEDLIIECDVKIAKIDVKTNTLLINHGCTVQADLVGDTVVIIGSFSGNVDAITQIDIQAGASVSANMSARQFKIHPDAIFQGQMKYKGQ